MLLSSAGKLTGPANYTRKEDNTMPTAAELSTQAGQLYSSGHAVEAIAKELGVTYRTARKALVLSGTELRDPSTRLKGRTRKSPTKAR